MRTVVMLTLCFMYCCDASSNLVLSVASITKMKLAGCITRPRLIGPVWAHHNDLQPSLEVCGRPTS